MAIAQKEGRGVGEVYWDIMINGGVVWKPFNGSYDGSYNMTCAMMNHPHIMPGFADAGAHGTIFQDAAIASHMLSYLARDRVKGPKMSLEHVVKLNSLEVASFFGFKDRGALQVGMRSDCILREPGSSFSDACCTPVCPSKESGHQRDRL